MTTTRKIIIGSFVGLAALCVYYYNMQIAMMENMTYNVLGVNVSNLNLDQATINLDVRLTSQASIQLTVLSMNINVFLNGVLLGNVQQQQPFIVPAKGYSDAQIAVNFSPSQLAGDALSLLTSLGNLGSLPVTFSGTAVVRNWIFTATIPISYTQSVNQLTS